jgi:dephospho-CoA kinase
VIIKNVSSYEDAWKQVSTAWKKYVSSFETPIINVSEPVHLSMGEVVVKRATPKQVNDIIDISNRLLNPIEPLTKEKVMAAFGEKAYLLLQVERSYLGILAWQVENLVSRTTEIALDPVLRAAQYIPIMIREMERASSDLQCEVSLVVTSAALARHDSLWKSLGYEPKKPEEISVLAWQEAAQECIQKGSVLFFKQLRMDRVLRPI